MRYDDLRTYLAARAKGEYGWARQYDQTVAGEPPDCAYLAGHYGALLDDVLGLIPPRLLDAALDAADEIEERQSTDAAGSRMEEL